MVAGSHPTTQSLRAWHRAGCAVRTGWAHLGLQLPPPSKWGSSDKRTTQPQCGTKATPGRRCCPGTQSTDCNQEDWARRGKLWPEARGPGRSTDRSPGREEGGPGKGADCSPGPEDRRSGDRSPGREDGGPRRGAGRSPGHEDGGSSVHRMAIYYTMTVSVSEDSGTRRLRYERAQPPGWRARAVSHS